MSIRILQGDCRDVLKTLPDESVHCVVTSPPYWGLRDYGTGTWAGGDEACKHEAPPKGGRNPETAGKQLTNTGTLNYQFVGTCGKCGATRTDSQLGLEPTPAEYVERMVDVFAEVRRVLRDDGTLWLNLGDSYASTPTGGQSSKPSKMTGGRDNQIAGSSRPDKTSFGLAAKQLVGIPWRVAFALQADGWYLRQDIIWAKPNPMPESVRDRCTKAHEYLFLLAKSERYYFDAEAISEESTTKDGRKPYARGQVDERGNGHDRGGGQDRIKTNRDQGARWNTDFRNKRSVWTVSTLPYTEAHFATFPPALIEPCILAGCPEGGTVLDPFGGAGTTGLVADRHKRSAILIELNPEYAEMSRKRIHNDGPLFADVA